MPRPLQEYLNGYYETVIEREVRPDGSEVFVARLTCLPRCLAQGNTETEAIALLDLNRRRMFMERTTRGVQLPEPDVVIDPEDRTSDIAAGPLVWVHGDVRTETETVADEGYAVA